MKIATSKGYHSCDVYKSYTSYPEPEGRTEKVLNFISDKIPSPKSILDIGTGTGSGIRVLSHYYPNAKVNGYDPYSSDFKKKPKGKFDLVTLFHTFEHVENLQETLVGIKESLDYNGHVLIQVPYARHWPFDLIIADHIWHFTKEALLQSLNNNRFRIVHIGNDVIRKEITVLATLGSIRNMLHDRRLFFDVVGWLLDYKKSLDTITHEVAIYGTGPAAAWSASILGDKAAYFLDDDKSRHGDKLNGLTIYSSDLCNIPVIAPFPEWQLDGVKKRSPHLNYIC